MNLGGAIYFTDNKAEYNQLAIVLLFCDVQLRKYVSVWVLK